MNRENLIKAIQELTLTLDDKVKWIVGASGALFVHGIDIQPNDIDLIVDSKEYFKAKRILKDFVVGATQDLGHTLKTPFLVSGVDGDLLSYDICERDIEYMNLDGVRVPVNSLETELG